MHIRLVGINSVCDDVFHQQFFGSSGDQIPNIACVMLEAGRATDRKMASVRANHVDGY